MDETKSKVVRVAAIKELQELTLNPVPLADFDPETFEPSTSGLAKIYKRPRKVPKRRLPTFGLKPKEIMEGQMVGMLETKQDLYLLIAWLSERLSDLEDQVEVLSTKP